MTQIPSNTTQLAIREVQEIADALRQGVLPPSLTAHPKRCAASLLIVLESFATAQRELQRSFIGTVLRDTAGKSAAGALIDLRSLEKKMRANGEAAASSVRVVAFAVSQLVAAFGPTYKVPMWRTASEARDAAKAAVPPQPISRRLIRNDPPR